LSFDLELQRGLLDICIGVAAIRVVFPAMRFFTAKVDADGAVAHNHIGKPAGGNASQGRGKAYALDGSSKKTVVNIKRCATASLQKKMGTVP